MARGPSLGHRGLYVSPVDIFAALCYHAGLDHPGERSLGTRPPLTGGWVFFFNCPQVIDP